MKALKNIAYLLLLVVLLAMGLGYDGPGQWAERWKLSGAFEKKDIPKFSVKEWVEGSYQAKVQNAMNDEIGFRGLCVRWRNQWQYWLFEKSNHWSTVFGKNNQILPLDYYWSFNGQDYHGKDSLRHQVKRLVEFDSILTAKQKQLLIVLAPGKVRYMPENLPEDYNHQPADSANYPVMKTLLERHQLPLLDLNQYFQQIKDTLSMPVFANTGLHWNAYGMTLALQKMIAKMEELHGQDLVNPRVESYSIGDKTIVEDQDLADMMNLLYPLQPEPQPWPKYDNSSQPEATKAKVLVIADSFFWGFYALPVTREVLADETRFWYYAKTEFDLEKNGQSTKELSAMEAVNAADYVIFLSNTGNSGHFTYGFAHRLLQEVKK